jgi:hypothetical protein
LLNRSEAVETTKRIVDMEETIVFDGVPSYSACATCKHLLSEGKALCNAFPCGIPDAIWYGWDDHSKPYNGDNGIQYEPIQQLAEAHLK